MFKHQRDAGEKYVTVFFEGKSVEVPEGVSVAAAVLGHAKADHTGVNAATGEKRAPYCLMGVCFECMVEIDGEPNQQACLVTVKDGMNIRKQSGLVELD